jgi:hypothetical protein
MLSKFTALPVMIRPMIVTRFIGPTNYRPSRAAASHRRDSETTYRAAVSWEHGLGSLENHQRAAQALADKIGFYDGAVKVEPVGHDNGHYYFAAVPV